MSSDTNKEIIERWSVNIAKENTLWIGILAIALTFVLILAYDFANLAGLI